MKLGIISDCVHYRLPDGRVATENHILLRQFNHLCSHFSASLICCPFAPYDSTKVVSYYTNTTMNFIEMPLVGGNSIKDKLRLLTVLPKWFEGYRQVDKFSDIVYQRFPNNINIPAFYYFYYKRKKVFGTYTGTWNAYEGEPYFYRLQRKLLTNKFRGPYWVYASEVDRNNKRIHNGFSPSYSQEEWDEESAFIANRVDAIRNKGLQKFRLITVGTLIYYKNQLGILQSCLELKKQSFPFSLKIVGGGPMLKELQQFIRENDLEKEVELTGKKRTDELRELYRQSDFVVQAPRFEGFGKVPIEGFFHGVIPVLNNIGLAGYMTGNEERGFLFNANHADSLVNTLIAIKDKIDLLPTLIDNGRKFAQHQTLEKWAKEYYATVSEFYKVP